MFPGCGNDDYSYYELHEIVFQECFGKDYKGNQLLVGIDMIKDVHTCAIERTEK